MNSKEDAQYKKELDDYRKRHPKPLFLLTQEPIKKYEKNIDNTD